MIYIFTRDQSKISVMFFSDHKKIVTNDGEKNFVFDTKIYYKLHLKINRMITII